MRLVFTLAFLVSFSIFLPAQEPAGYYNTATGTGATLKTQLSNIIQGHTTLSYAALWTAFQTTDRKSNGKVWDMYSDVPSGTPPYEYTFSTDQCGTISAEGSCYDREHSFPKSWFGGTVSPMYTDLFHIIPADGYVNGRRSNYPYGTVAAPTWTSQNGCKIGPCSFPGYTGTVFEPIDAYKGDLARNYFYMVTSYENQVAAWHANDSNAEAVLQPNSFPVFEPWFLNMLLQWNAADPVSQKEIDRNNAVYALQHNRNPYIDHPEFVNRVWGNVSGYASTLSATSVTTATAQLNGIVNPGGLSTSYYFEYGSTATYGSATTAQQAGSGSSDLQVNAALTGLSAGSVYHFRIVASNSVGTYYGSDLTFTTPSAAGPVALSASNITATGFTANWTAVSGATGYKLDVSTSNTFASASSGTLTEGFDAGTLAPAGWTFTNIAATYTTSGNFGAASPSLKLDATGDVIQTPVFSGAASSLSFWIKGQGTDATSALLVQGYDGTSWLTIQNITASLPTSGTVFTYNATSSPGLPQNLTQFKFSYTKSVGNLSFDDVSVVYAGASSFVPGYENLAVSGYSQAVTGLSTNTAYYYRVRSVDASGTSANSNVISVTTNASGSAPAAFAVTGGGSYCLGGSGIAVGLAGSESGTTYILYQDNVAVQTIAGNGSALNFGMQTAGVFTVQGTNSFGTTSMTGNATVVAYPLPVAFAVTGGDSYCSGGTGVVVGLSGSQTGVNYQLYVGTTATGSAIAGTGAALNFGLQTNSGTYTVAATSASGCTQLMTGSASISINPLPVAFAVTGGGSYCSGGTGVAVGLSGSQTGVNYQLYNGTTATGSVVAGTGSALNFGLQTSAGTYTVAATSASGCTQLMTGSASVSINPLPVAFAVTGGGSYCSGGTGVVVGLSGSQTGINYQLYVGTTATGSAVAGTGTALNFGLQKNGGTYTVTASPGTACSLTMTGNAVVVVNPLPVVTISGLASVLTGTTAVYSTQPGMTNYTWSVLKGSITAGGSAASSTATVKWGTSVGTGHVYVNYSNSFGCRATANADYAVIIKKKNAGEAAWDLAQTEEDLQIAPTHNRIFAFDHTLVVESADDGMVQVFDLVGRLIDTHKVTSGENRFHMEASGFYVARLILADQKLVQKVWISR